MSRDKQKNRKKYNNEYHKRVLEIEHGSFTPLIFSATSGAGREKEINPAIDRDERRSK